MKLYIVKREEFSGYECDGHWQTILVAAHSAEQAAELVVRHPFAGENEVAELIIPNLDRLKRPRVIA